MKKLRSKLVLVLIILFGIVNMAWPATVALTIDSNTGRVINKKPITFDSNVTFRAGISLSDITSTNLDAENFTVTGSNLFSGITTFATQYVDRLVIGTAPSTNAVLVWLSVSNNSVWLTLGNGLVISNNILSATASNTSSSTTVPTNLPNLTVSNGLSVLNGPNSLGGITHFETQYVTILVISNFVIPSSSTFTQVVSSTDGWLWHSNKSLYWVTDAGTNKISP